MLILEEAIKKSKIDSVPNFSEWLALRKLEKKIVESNDSQTEWDKAITDAAKKSGFKDKEELFRIMGTEPDGSELQKKAKSVLDKASADYKKTK